MYKLHWGELSAERFLAEYWQKKPLFIKGAFKQFVDPIDADELAGLAMEDEVESRIIAQDQQGQWQVHHGPFQAFDQLGDKRWSLLVQATNNWSQTTAQLLKPFKFMPNWRIDDVMVSYSTPEGGVGAHLDQYDVFIIQGQGKRHWRVGLPDESLAQLLPHPDLKQVSEFSACIDVITQAGDLLYIPPNHPHQGIAIEHALNFSVGFQAPNAQDLWSCFADQLIDNGAGLTRFADQHRACCAKPELLSQQDIIELKHFMFKQLSDENMTSLMAKFLTQAHHELDIIEPEQAFTTDDLIMLSDDHQLQLKPVLGIKILRTEAPEQLFINGMVIDIDEETRYLANILAVNENVTMASIKSSLGSLKNQVLLTTVLNMGFWYLE